MKSGVLWVVRTFACNSDIGRHIFLVPVLSEKGASLIFYAAQFFSLSCSLEFVDQFINIFSYSIG